MENLAIFAELSQTMANRIQSPPFLKQPIPSSPAPGSPQPAARPRESCDSRERSRRAAVDESIPPLTPSTRRDAARWRDVFAPPAAKRKGRAEKQADQHSERIAPF